MASNVPATIVEHATENVDLGEISSLLRRRIGTIIVFMAIAIGFALIYVLFATPQFTAKGALYLGDTNSGDGAPETSSLSSLNFLSDYSDGADVETQIELITAGSLVQRAILETGLNAQITPAGAPPLTYWRWKLFDGGNTATFLPTRNTLQALYATQPGSYKIVLGTDNNYTLYTRPHWFGSARPVLQGVLGKPASGDAGQILIEPSGVDFQAQPGASYDLTVTLAAALATTILGDNLSVVAGGNPQQPTKIAFLQFRWHDPYQAQQFVNRVMQDYIASQLSWTTQSASAMEDFVTGQLSNVSAELAVADQNLAAYQANTGIVDVPQNAQISIDQQAKYETQRTTLQLQQKALQQLNEQLTSNVGSLNPYLLSQTNDPVLAGLTTRLSDAQVKLSQIAVQFNGHAEEYKIQAAQIMQLEHSIKSIAHNDLLSVNSNLADLNNVIKEFQDQNKSMPAEALKVISLKRSADVLGQLYVLLMQKQEEAQVSKAATIVNTRVVTPADMPLTLSSPKAVITVIFAAFVGLASGIGLIFARRAFSGRFESEEQIRAQVRLPVYAAVPRHSEADMAQICIGTRAGGYERNAFLESFRLLRGSVYRLKTENKAMVIVIISAWKDDGKTTIAVNLAKSLANDGKRVVLVDGDTHLSRLNGLLKMGRKRGLTDWLVNSKMPQLQKWPNEKFKILPTGRTRLADIEKLNEIALEPIFRCLSESFEYIIVDSPPLPTVSDGMIFGSFADLILSVISVSHTPRHTLSVHNELIQKLKRPHGIVINEVETRNYDQYDAYFLPEVPWRLRVKDEFIGRQARIASVCAMLSHRIVLKWAAMAARLRASGQGH